MGLNNRKSMIIIMVLCLCIGITGCKLKEKDEIEITVIHGWGSTEKDHAVMRQVYENFEKEHPHIRLKLTAMPSSTDVINKVSDLLTVGEIPDVIFTGGDGKNSIYNFMRQKGHAVDLSPYLEADQELAESVSPIILKEWMTETGELYTVSDVLLMGGYWYNREIFERAGILEFPMTWEEWLDACEKIETLEGEITPVVLDTEHVSYLMTAILADEMGIKSQDEFRIDVNSTAFDNMLEKLRRIVDNTTIAEDYSYRDTLLAFNRGESAIYINGVWAGSMIWPELSVAYAPFPTESGEGIGTLSACVGYILGNTGDEKRITASVEFLKYMLSEPVAEQILNQTGQLPSNPNIEVSEKNASARMVQAVNSIKRASVIVPTPENLWDLSEKEEFGESVILYLKDEITKEELKKRLFLN